jgi:endonuclease YncB( thermonuclease family)
MDAICPTVIGSLVGIWSALHKNLEVVIDPVDTIYLEHVLLGLDDELVAHLLAAKLALARSPEPNSSATSVRTGSDVTYSVEGRELTARLVHGARAFEGRLGVATRFGTALIGLRCGQTVLWPTARGRLVEVRILRIDATDRHIAENGAPPPPEPVTACASG